MTRCARPPGVSAAIKSTAGFFSAASKTISADSECAELVSRSRFARPSAIVLTGLSQTVIRAFVVVVGALALQDTLSNLFGGFHVLADQPVRVGDLIRLENGMEGVVEDIGCARPGYVA